MVHKWRAEEQAILVGTNTVLADNPKLNVRSWFGNNPLRIVLDRNLKIESSAHVLDKSIRTIVFTEKKIDSSEENLQFETIDFTRNIAKQICDVLGKHQVQSVIIEGGAKTLQTFIDENLWDEARVFTGDVLFTDGIQAPNLKATIFSEKNIKNDTLKIYYND